MNTVGIWRICRIQKSKYDRLYGLGGANFSTHVLWQTMLALRWGGGCAVHREQHVRHECTERERRRRSRTADLVGGELEAELARRAEDALRARSRARHHRQRRCACLWLRASSTRAGAGPAHTERQACASSSARLGVEPRPRRSASGPHHLRICSTTGSRCHISMPSGMSTRRGSSDALRGSVPPDAATPAISTVACELVLRRAQDLAPARMLCLRHIT